MYIPSQKRKKRTRDEETNKCEIILLNIKYRIENMVCRNEIGKLSYHIFFCKATEKKKRWWSEAGRQATNIRQKKISEDI